MRWVSRADSADQGEISFLAVVETLAAIAIALFIIKQTDHVAWLIGWTSFGWLYLLRNSTSTRLACKAFDLHYQRCLKTERTLAGRPISARRKRRRPAPVSVARRHIVLVGQILYSGLVMALVDKFLATAYTLFRRPRRALLSIPDNWFRTVACVDSFSPIELVPGFTQYRHRYPSRLPDVGSRTREHLLSTAQEVLGRPVAKWGARAVSVGILIALGYVSSLVTKFLIDDGLELGNVLGFLYEFDRIIIWLLIATFLANGIIASLVADGWLRACLYLPAVFYRITLKTTAIVYFPLLFGVYGAASPVPIESQYRDVRDSVWGRWRVRISLAYILLFAAKVVLYSVGVRLATGLLRLASGSFTTIQLEGYPAPLWQWASLLSSLLTVGMVLFADWCLGRIRDNLEVHRLAMVRILQVVRVTCGVLSTYSIGANIWWVAHRTPLIVWPGIGPIWP